jgi:hypothetical protein
MVERAEKEHSIHRGVVEIQVARVAHRGMEALGSRGLVAELLDVERHQIAMLDPVPEFREPERITAGPAADVGDYRGRRGKLTEDDLGGPCPFEQPAVLGQPIAFQALVVVPPQVLPQLRFLHAASSWHAAAERRILNET